MTNEWLAKNISAAPTLVRSTFPPHVCVLRILNKQINFLLNQIKVPHGLYRFRIVYKLFAGNIKKSNLIISLRAVYLFWQVRNIVALIDTN